jgi:hypothetical protein
MGLYLLDCQDQKTARDHSLGVFYVLLVINYGGITQNIASSVARRSVNVGSAANGKHLANALVCCNKAAAKALQVASPHRLQLVWGNKVQISSKARMSGSETSVLT